MIDFPTIANYKISMPVGITQRLNFDRLRLHGFVDAGTVDDIVGRIQSVTVQAEGSRQQLLVLHMGLFDNPSSRRIRKNPVRCVATIHGNYADNGVMHVERFTCSATGCGYVCLVECQG